MKTGLLFFLSLFREMQIKALLYVFIHMPISLSQAFLKVSLYKQHVENCCEETVG